jgi:hypothetical protein
MKELEARRALTNFERILARALNMDVAELRLVKSAILNKAVSQGYTRKGGSKSEEVITEGSNEQWWPSRPTTEEDMTLCIANRSFRLTPYGRYLTALQQCRDTWFEQQWDTFRGTGDGSTEPAGTEYRRQTEGSDQGKEPVKPMYEPNQRRKEKQRNPHRKRTRKSNAKNERRRVVDMSKFPLCNGKKEERENKHTDILVAGIEVMDETEQEETTYRRGPPEPPEALTKEFARGWKDKKEYPREDIPRKSAYQAVAGRERGGRPDTPRRGRLVRQLTDQYRLIRYLEEKAEEAEDTKLAEMLIRARDTNSGTELVRYLQLNRRDERLKDLQEEVSYLDPSETLDINMTREILTKSSSQILLQMTNGREDTTGLTQRIVSEFEEDYGIIQNRYRSPQESPQEPLRKATTEPMDQGTLKIDQESKPTGENEPDTSTRRSSKVTCAPA